MRQTFWGWRPTIASLIRLFIVALFALAALETAGGAIPNGRTMVFDMDGIVLFHVPPDSEGQRLIRAQTDSTGGGDIAAEADVYRVADGFGELIDFLVERGWRVSVFSFGNALRNRSAASAISLPRGGTLLSAIEATGGRVYSNVDGYNLDPNDLRKVIYATLPKAQRPKIVKDLAKVMPAQEAAQAFLVEDILINSAPGKTIAGNRLPGQRETHTVHMPYRYVIDANGKPVHFMEYPDGFEGAVRRSDLRATRHALELFSELRNKMAYLAGLVVEIESRMAANPRQSFSDVLQDMQWQREANGAFRLDRNGDRMVRPELLSSDSITHRGSEILERMPNSSYKFVLPFNPGKLCGPLAQAFDRMLSTGH